LIERKSAFPMPISSSSRVQRFCCYALTSKMLIDMFRASPWPDSDEVPLQQRQTLGYMGLEEGAIGRRHCRTKIRSMSVQHGSWFP